MGLCVLTKGFNLDAYDQTELRGLDLRTENFSLDHINVATNNFDPTTKLVKMDLALFTRFSLNFLCLSTLLKLLTVKLRIHTLYIKAVSLGAGCIIKWDKEAKNF